MAAKKENSLFIGKEFLNVEGRTIKHPALINVYATPTIKKTRDEIKDLIGLDLETDPNTAELKLLGFYENGNYAPIMDNFIENLFSFLRYAERNDKAIAYWNKLDPFVLFKQFLLRLETEEAQNHAMSRYNKISGEWYKKKKYWRIKPVVEIELANGYMFGIKNVIRSSIQFFFYNKSDPFMNTIWAYDIASLYEKDIKTEAKRFDYYSKIALEAHVVDWNRFHTDKKYKLLVLKSNELDARVVRDLGLSIQESFKNAFGYYPKTLISQGSLARAAIVASLLNKYKDHEKETRASVINSDIRSIGILSFIEELQDKGVSTEIIKNMYSCTCEAYSGGYIEAIRYGYSKKGYTADIASAYPATIVELYDLRGAILTTGKGIPPTLPYSYCFIRGLVNIPIGVQFHPITIKHLRDKGTNIRAVGEYYASYTLEEREFLIEHGATFSEEEWFNIETTGKLSSIAPAVNSFLDLRKHFLSIGSSDQFIAKIAANSAYGILYEAVDTYEEIEDIERVGYRAGEFFNPIYATIITSRTRLKLARAAAAIEEAGGKVILLMTDSVLYEGTIDMLPSNMWTEKKTLGYFEKPEAVTDIVCLGSGRYEYKKENLKYVSKRRGLSVEDIHNPDGTQLSTIHWLEQIKSLTEAQMTINVRTLVSVGLVLNNHEFHMEDLGLIIDQKRKVDLIVGKNKRMSNYKQHVPAILSKKLIDTESIILTYGMLGDSKFVDQTLPILRAEMMQKKLLNQQEKRRKSNRKSQAKFKDKNYEELKKVRKTKYDYILEQGFSATEARKMSFWSVERIEATIARKGENA